MEKIAVDLGRIKIGNSKQKSSRDGRKPIRLCYIIKERENMEKKRKAMLIRGIPNGCCEDKEKKRIV